MLDITLSFFENLSPEILSLPFMVLKAEMWDGYLPPPSNQELVNRIRKRKTESGLERLELGQFSDHDEIYMLARAPIEYLVQLREDVRFVQEHDSRNFVKKIYDDVTGTRPKDNIAIATARFLFLHSSFISIHAGNLKHNADKSTNSVMEWGLEAEHALGRFLSEALRRVRQQSFHQKNNASHPTQNLKEALEIKRYTGLSGLLRESFDMIFDFSPKDSLKHKLKGMDFDERMTHALDILAALEDACQEDIRAGKERIRSYEETQKIISCFFEILEAHHDSLDREAPRLKKEEAEWFQTGGDPIDKLRAKFKSTSLKIKEDIAERLHALRKSMHICEIEYGAYENMIEAEKNSWDAINHLIQNQIPLFRQQLIQAQNIKAGRVAVDMDNLSASLRKLSGDKLKERAAQEIVNGVHESLNDAAKTLDQIANDEVKAITKAETLMIEDQRPIALITDQRETEISPA